MLFSSLIFSILSVNFSSNIIQSALLLIIEFSSLRYIKQNLKEYKVTLFVGVPVLVEAIYKTIMKEIQKQGKTKIIEVAMKISNILCFT